MSPDFSIVIPTYNRPQQLAGCLEALTRLDYPRDALEILIVDDGSLQPLDETVSIYRSRLPLALLRQKNRGPAAARNTGLRQAAGHWIAFTDDDCRPSPGWLCRLREKVLEQPKALVGGRTINGLMENVYSVASQLLIDYLYDYFVQNVSFNQFFTTSNMAACTELLRAIGGFDERFRRAAGEDRELCSRWQHSEEPLVYAPEAVVHHFHALTLRSFWRQHFVYGMGAQLLHSARARRKQRFEPPRFYLGMLAYPFRQRCRSSAALSVLMGLTQVSHTAGFFTARLRRGPDKPGD